MPQHKKFPWRSFGVLCDGRGYRDDVTLHSTQALSCSLRLRLSVVSSVSYTHPVPNVLAAELSGACTTIYLQSGCPAGATGRTHTECPDTVTPAQSHRPHTLGAKMT